MRQYMEIYDMARSTKASNKSLLEGPLRPMLNKPEGFGLIHRDAVVDQFKRDHKVSKYEAELVLKSAIEKGYIIHYHFDKVDSVDITPDKGVDILQKVGRFRFGMWNDIVKHYSSSYTVIIAVVALAVSIISVIIVYRKP